MPDALERPPASLLPLPSDPKTWHADTRDVFLIVGSKLTAVKTGDEKVAMSFLDDIRPFERARISSGLRDLLHMEIIQTHYDVDADAFSMSQAEHFAAARKAHDIPKTININHLKAPGAPPRRPVKR